MKSKGNMLMGEGGSYFIAQWIFINGMQDIMKKMRKIFNYL